MTIRPATARDAAALVAIWNPIIRDTTIIFHSARKTPEGVAEMIETRTAAGQGFFVADEGGAILGLATYGPFRPGDGYARTMEHTILLAPGGQGRGLGRALMGALETHAADAGVHAMIAAVSADNPGGIAFHAALGYAEVGRLPQVGVKAGRFLDLVLMQKMLSVAPDTGPATG
ncbi:GNAT family N-acetyltransferase [Rhodovulum steppense]|uniref:Phosphinothricin acetyltransferase n=1 Tax=Rhodovulum steppense TaxID=540251 RepID=A0A4R1Z300_9RHOB|nr:GNAT family N-acetyltransferase [Rhodovulum steppense]TCM88051.1 phosphinothricin acetyltransferase [Rhodovulum steppense]